MSITGSRFWARMQVQDTYLPESGLRTMVVLGIIALISSLPLSYLPLAAWPLRVGGALAVATGLVGWLRRFKAARRQND